VITKRGDASRGLTREELLAAPAAVDLERANRALSLSRTTGYDLAKRGRYPCTVESGPWDCGCRSALDLLVLSRLGMTEAVDALASQTPVQRPGIAQEVADAIGGVEGAADMAGADRQNPHGGSALPPVP
jgi:hypothetical protein